MTQVESCPAWPTPAQWEIEAHCCMPLSLNSRHLARVDGHGFRKSLPGSGPWSLASSWMVFLDMLVLSHCALAVISCFGAFLLCAYKVFPSNIWLHLWKWWVWPSRQKDSESWQVQKEAVLGVCPEQGTFEQTTKEDEGASHAHICQANSVFYEVWFHPALGTLYSSSLHPESPFLPRHLTHTLVLLTWDHILSRLPSFLGGGWCLLWQMAPCSCGNLADFQVFMGEHHLEYIAT